MSKRNNGMKKQVILLAALLLILAGCITVAVKMVQNDRLQGKDAEEQSQDEGNQTDKENEPVKTEEELQMEKIRETVDAMTLEEKTAQLFMITPEQLTEVETVTAAGEATKEAFDIYPVGGLIYFRKNLLNTEQTKEMLVNTQRYAMEKMDFPVFLSVDEEGGQVSRIAGNTGFDVVEFPYMSEIGAGGDTNQAYEVGEQIGLYLSELGFNMDQAPVADVFTNPENEVIKYRSFGADPELAAKMTRAVMEGLESQNIISVYKHFPGHGGTSGDTHEGYAYVDSTLEELQNTAFVPFKDGIEAGVKFIMAGHISCPNVTGTTEPAILSPKMIQEILRGELGYDGVVITDAMNMGAITAQYASDQAAVLALKAGVDILLMPEDFKMAYNGVIKAVESGELTEERIDESMIRILKVKLEMKE